MDAGAKSNFIATRDLPWRDSPHAGVRWKKIRFDGRGSVVLLHFEPGASYGAHRHPEGEEYWVIEGSIHDGGRVHGPGTWIEHPPGSIHRPRSEEGCLLLVRLPAPIEPIDSPGADEPSLGTLLDQSIRYRPGLLDGPEGPS